MQLEEPSGPLVGLRVLDLTRGRAGAIAGMLLADYGADVLRIEPPGGDPLWDELPGYAVWHRGKDVVEIDLQQPDAQSALRKRLPVADVFLNGLRSGALEAIGLGYASVAEIAPALVYATVSGFGPDADEVPALEGLVQARLGWPTYQGARHGHPVASPYPAASYGAGLLLVIGVLAALHQRETTGAGQHVDTSLVDGLLAQLATTLVQPVDGPVATPRASGGDATRGVLRCGDGAYLQVDLGARGALDVLGLAKEDVARAGTGRDPGGAPEGGERFGEALADVLRKRARDEWVDRFQAADVPAAPCSAPGEVLDHPHVRAVGMTTELRDPLLGAIRTVSPPIGLDGSPARVRGPALLRGMPRNPEAALRHTGWLTAEEVAASERPQLGAMHGGAHTAPEDASPAPVALEGKAQPAGAPLEGLRVLDFGTSTSGPYAAMLLAELGADVIAIQSPGGDARGTDALASSGLHRRKRGLGLDLEREAAGDVVRRLVGTADVLVHDLPPGGAERLGIGWDQLAPHHPRLLHFQVTGYGTAGPMASVPGCDSIYQAVCGLAVAHGGEGRSPEPMAGAPLDGLNALLTAAGILMALRHRDRTGQGQHGECAQLAAGLLASSEVYRTPTGPTHAGRLDAERLRLGDGASIERAADGWVYVCRPDDAARERFAALVEELGDGALSSAAWLARLRDADVPAAPIRATFDGTLLSDALLTTHGRSVEVSDPALGRVRQPGGFLRFSGARLPDARGAPAPGEHTREILQELGLEDATATLLDAHVVVEPGGET